MRVSIDEANMHKRTPQPIGMQRFTALVALLALSLLGAVAAAAPSSAATTFRVFGSVTSSTGAPVPDATVEISNSTTASAVASTVTDASGSWQVLLPAGTYNGQVTPSTASGLQSTLLSGSVVQADTQINLVLTPTSGRRISRVWRGPWTARPSGD